MCSALAVVSQLSRSAGDASSAAQDTKPKVGTCSSLAPPHVVRDNITEQGGRQCGICHRTVGGDGVGALATYAGKRQILQLSQRPC